jgi:hypothetical protein
VAAREEGAKGAPGVRAVKAAREVRAKEAREVRAKEAREVRAKEAREVRERPRQVSILLWLRRIRRR